MILNHLWMRCLVLDSAVSQLPELQEMHPWICSFILASTNGDPGLNAATLTGSLGVKAYFGSAETSKTFKQNTWYLYTRNNQQKKCG